MCLYYNLPCLSLSSRSALDVMRLVELLVVLVMEGRKALPKSPHPVTVKQMDSFGGDRSHRQVIEAIRAGNNEEFFEAMGSGESIPRLLITLFLTS